MEYESYLKTKQSKPRVFDIFCGVGGLALGSIKEGFGAVGRVDSDGSWRYSYERSNGVRFIEEYILDISATELKI